MKSHVSGAAIALAVASVGALLLALPDRLPSHPAGVALAQTRAEVASCTGVVTQQLSAEIVRTCDTAIVTSRVSAACLGCAGGLNVVFVEIGNGPANVTAQNQEALRILDVIGKHAELRPAVGVVHYFLTNSRVMLDLTSDLGKARQPLGLPRYQSPGWGMDHAGAARLTTRMLDGARASMPAGSPPPCELVVYFALVIGGSTGEGQREVAAFRSAINQIRGTKAQLYIGCPMNPGEPSSNLCDEPQRVGGSNYALTTGTGTLARLVDRGVGAQGEAPSVIELSLVQMLPTGLSYDPVGASPPPAISIGGGLTRLAWPWVAPDASRPQTVTYRVRPLAEGTWPITASLAITDDAGASVIVPAQPVTLTVAGLCETPTLPPSPTATPLPTATPTHTPEPTPTLEVTATATATTLPPPRALYLPLGLKERCNPERKRADVALVLDTSSSMADQKIADAKNAALDFVARMDLSTGGDQVAVVRFDRDADLVLRLTRDRAAIDAAIAGLATREGTHIDTGLRTALGELQSERHVPDNLQVVILLTDGMHNGTPGADQAAAAEVRDVGVRLYVIGLGADVDESALRQMAADPDRYYFAPDSTALAGIYAEIAVDIACPVVGFWGQG